MGWTAHEQRRRDSGAAGATVDEAADTDGGIADETDVDAGATTAAAGGVDGVASAPSVVDASARVDVDGRFDESTNADGRSTTAASHAAGVPPRAADGACAALR